MIDETDRLKQLLGNRTQELNEWRTKYYEMEPIVDERRTLDDKARQLEHRFVGAQQEIDRLIKINR